jgi:excinuclease ABC subunit A
MQDYIVIKGAREHNLKNLGLSIPRDRVTVITGPSGSGKSSLAIDTIYAEGQRRYVESLSAYARQFLEQLQKPDVDSIEGLSPSIAINQRTVAKTLRSTVGTITEVYDYMRVLYTRIGRPFCYNCGSPIASQSIDGIINTIMNLPMGSRVQVLAPIVRDRKGVYKKELQEMRAEGFIRARIDGEMRDLTGEIKLGRHQRHTIEIAIDRLKIKKNMERQLHTSIETALKYSETVIINLTDEDRDIPLSRTMACPDCGISYPDLNPRFFSFNSRLGACPSCNGLGVEGEVDDEGNGNGSAPPEEDEPCGECGGARLRKEALHIRIGGINISEFSAMPVTEALPFINGLKLTEREATIAERVLKEVCDRLGFLVQVGLGYLSLDRSSRTISGGEAQRIRLATQMGSSLTGVLYVLDEPSMGLHPRDCNKLLQSLSGIRDRGNTVIVVEHDEDTIRWADNVVDMGPGAGSKGGWVTATGSPADVQKHEKSLTGKYLSGELNIPVPKSRRTPTGFIEVTGAHEHNLKGIDINVPLGVFACVTGVSGSGKSTFVFDILYRALKDLLDGQGPSNGPADPAERYRSIKGAEKVDKVICVEQRPLGRTPRSNPATYSGVLTLIRDLFAALPESRVRGYASSRFSFNVKGGRCETCGGAGIKKVEMHFMPDVFVSCDDCRGRRYNRETLHIEYKGRNIFQVLEMTVSEALEFFEPVPKIRKKLELLEDVGLGYIRLGQPAPTLSGGEAQRLRLARELAKKSTGSTLYILDEPTTGLHFVDIERLLNVLNSLVHKGNTVLVIEHNPEIVKSADFLIDLGPEGGEKGGRLVASGTPEQVAREKGSYTGMFLAEKLGRDKAAL